MGVPAFFKWLIHKYGGTATGERPRKHELQQTGN
eukprot:gene32815-10056_t